jgi:hypothetical protein
LVPRAGAITAGFALGGSSPCRILIRAIGPSLSSFGVPEPLPQPTFEVYRGEHRQAQAASGWNGASEIASAALSAGAFTISAASADAALVITLAPGNYTIVVKGSSAEQRGEVVVEVYLLV